MINSLKANLGMNITNSKGWRTNRKIVVIESDDWGSIRMPSKEVFNTLKKQGIPVEKSPYCKFDSLESNEDLEALFEVLTSFKDINGSHPIITANTVVANPDFEKIEESSYKKYFYEPFTKTLKRYPNHNKVLNLYQEGIANNVFFPQFHGREHVNIELWFKLLKTDKNFKLAFKHNMWGLSNDVLPGLKSIQATYDSTNINLMKDSISSGLSLFEDIFGYKSKTFIANNFIWDIKLEDVLFDGGVVCFQGMKYQKLPKEDGRPRKMIRHHLGSINKNKQLFSVRNCSFEPSIYGDSFKKTLKDIQNAFFWKKPAIISSHRVNFIGGLEETNRKTNLANFKKLIDVILTKWPEVEFIHSSELADLMNNQKYK